MSSNTLAFDTFTESSDTKLSGHTPNIGGAWQVPSIVDPDTPASDIGYYVVAATDELRGFNVDSVAHHAPRVDLDITDSGFTLFADVRWSGSQSVTADLFAYMSDSTLSSPGVRLRITTTSANTTKIELDLTEDNLSSSGNGATSDTTVAGVLTVSSAFTHAGGDITAAHRYGFHVIGDDLAVFASDGGGESNQTILYTGSLNSSATALRDGNHKRFGTRANATIFQTSFIDNFSVTTIVGGSAATIPSASTLSSVVSGSYQVSSTWSSTASVTGYRLEKRGPSDATFSTVSSTTTDTFLSYVESGLVSGSSYTYAVVSFNTHGDGARSNLVALQTDPGVVPSTSTLSSIPLDTSRTSSEWSSSDSVVGYKLQRQGVSDVTFNTIFSSASTGYINTGLTSFSSYTYGVVSYNTEGDGARSNLVALRTQEVFSPPPTDPADPWTPKGGPGAPGSGGAGTAGAGTVSAVVGGPWARAYPQSVSSDGGVDYELQARADFAFSVSSDRPHAIVSSISEGRP